MPRSRSALSEPTAFLSVYETASIFSVTPKTVRKWITKGYFGEGTVMLPGSSEYRIPAPDVKKLADQSNVPENEFLEACVVEFNTTRNPDGTLKMESA